MTTAKSFISTVESCAQELREVDEWGAWTISVQHPPPPMLRTAVNEIARKEQLLTQGTYGSLALRQAGRRQAIATYASLNYAVDGEEAA